MPSDQQPSVSQASKPIFLKSDGDAIIDNYALLSFLDSIDETSPQGLQRRISDMSRVIEGLVFFERLFVFSFRVDKANSEAYFSSDNPLILASIIEELSREKVLSFVSVLPVDYSPQPSVLLAQVDDLKLISKKQLAKVNGYLFGYYLYQQEIARRLDLPFISSDSRSATMFVSGSNTFKCTSRRGLYVTST